MPYEYRVADAEGLIHVTAWGEADLVEVVALLRQMEADAQVLPGMPVLVDARNQQFRLPRLQLRQLADPHAGSRGGPRALNYGLGRMLSVFSEMRGAVLQAFGDHGDALAWVRSQVSGGDHGQEA